MKIAATNKMGPNSVKIWSNHACFHILSRFSEYVYMIYKDWAKTEGAMVVTSIWYLIAMATEALKGFAWSAYVTVPPTKDMLKIRLGLRTARLQRYNSSILLKMDNRPISIQ